MTRMLGCVEEAKFRVIRNGRKVLETDKVNCVWDRVVDDTSKASFTVPVSCCPATVHAVADFGEFERNGVVEWAGYITRPEFDGNTLTLAAEDLLWGYQRRIIKQAFTHVDIDLSMIFTDYAAAASDYDPLPIILTPNASGILATRTVTTAEYRIAWSAMKELLDVGLDVTTVGLRAFVGPLDSDLSPIRLTERMVVGGLQPKIGEDGLAYANRIVGKGANGLVSIYPPGPPAAPNGSYPLIEAVLEASDIEDQASLDLFVLEQWTLRSALPTFVNMGRDGDNLSLSDQTPYELSELIAGRLVNGVFNTECGLIQQAMRLSRVGYTLDGLREIVQPELVPAGVVAPELVSA